VVGDEHEHPGPVRLVDRPSRIRHHECPYAEPAEHAHAKDCAVGSEPFVEMRPAPHDCNRHSVHCADHEHTRVSDRRRDGPSGNSVVGDLNAVLHRIRKPTEAAAQHDSDGRNQVGLLPNRRKCVLERQAEPSSRRIL
jgi:hypothetical protein